MATKLIFGLRAPQATQLVITNEQREMLAISLTSRNGETISTRCDGEPWTVDLAQGDYLVRVEGERSEKLWFKVTPKAGIFSYKDLESTAITARWQLAGAGDPKNPWPPPEGEDFALDDAQWLTSELQKVRPSTTTVTREGPPWPGPPPPRSSRDRSES